MASLHSRHWAIIALGAMGTAAIFMKYDAGTISAILAAIGGMFLWDKVASHVGKNQPDETLA